MIKCESGKVLIDGNYIQCLAWFSCLTEALVEVMSEIIDKDNALRFIEIAYKDGINDACCETEEITDEQISNALHKIIDDVFSEIEKGDN